MRPVALLVATLLLVAGCSNEPHRPPNIALIVLDTLRADRLDCGGGAAGLTPNLDAFCSRSVRFTRASSTSSWTLPAHASLFTGLYPMQHGATQEHLRLEAGAPTLAEILSAAGYRTFGVSANPMVGVDSGLARGFDEFAETWRKRPASPHPAPEEHANARAVANLLGVPRAEQPFFLFVNYIEVHGPNDPPDSHRVRTLGEDFDVSLVEGATRRSARRHYLDPDAISPAEFAALNDLYDAEVAYLDELVGGLLDALEAHGHLDDTVVIVTSDHGENLGDHGHFRHIFSLYGSTVHIPLLVRLPGDRHAGSVRNDPVGLADVFASILAFAGAKPPAAASSGRDLFADGAEASAASVFAEYYYPLQALALFANEQAEELPPQIAPHLRRLRSIEADGLRLIWSSDGRHELFDLDADPGERRNLSGDPRFAAAQARLQQRLDAFVAEGGGPRPYPELTRDLHSPGGAFEDLDPESAALLRELGYLPP